MSWNPAGPSIEARRRDFLMTVESYAEPPVVEHAAGVLDALLAWSQSEPALEPSRAGMKQAVAYRVGAEGPVLWSAHPRHGEEPALLILPTLGVELDDERREALSREVSSIPSRWPVEETGAVTVSFSSLHDPEAQRALHALLGALVPVAEKYA